MSKDKWDAWDDYDGCIRNIHIEVAICVGAEVAVRWVPWWRNAYYSEVAAYGQSNFNALSKTAKNKLLDKGRDKAKKALKKYVRPLCSIDVIKNQAICWVFLNGELNEAEDHHDERGGFCEGDRSCEESAAVSRIDDAIDRLRTQREQREGIVVDLFEGRDRTQARTRLENPFTGTEKITQTMKKERKSLLFYALNFIAEWIAPLAAFGGVIFVLLYNPPH
ncbi:MAG: hypothetical protein M2R45_02767 [Verrucomicrobia subdivision 3 bacterium]|nr:hypothetical protein [Limisphaerales bacterium]MCS1414316.1 hypothetical protein [Limisphaerales bacterium]